MSDYPNVDALVHGRPWNVQMLHLEIAAMVKQVEAQKQRIASLIKELAKAPYPHQLNQLREQLETLKKRDNEQAATTQEQITQIFNWSHQNADLFRRLDEKSDMIAALQKQLRGHDSSVKFEIRLLDAQFTDKDKVKLLGQLDALKQKNEEYRMAFRKCCLDALDEGAYSWVKSNHARMEAEIKQLSTELLETQKDVSFLRAKELREENEELRIENEELKADLHLLAGILGGPFDATAPG